jgi:Ca-activated chloride channel family protein
MLLIGGFAAVVFAMTRPAWNPKPREIKRKGRDVVILLDVSRSMLAEDIKPNRLERAKIAIKDLMEKLRGDRIGIVTFAGNSSVKCPLTQDYAFVQMAIDRLAPESTTRGGTNVGDAIRQATSEVFDEQVKEFKDIILITDCDDQEGSFPEKAAEQAGQKGIRIIAVGLGNPNEGARIPIMGSDGTKTFLKYNGQEVWTKLDDKTLRKIATATGGAYIPVETGTFDLGQIYLDLIRSAAKENWNQQLLWSMMKNSRYFWPLDYSVLSARYLSVNALRNKTTSEYNGCHAHARVGMMLERKHACRRQAWHPVWIWIVFLGLAAANVGFAESAKSLVSEGNALYRQQQYKEAGQKYNQAVEADPKAAEALFNKANSLYRQGQYDAAVEAFQKAAVKSKDTKLAAKAKYNLGNCLFGQGQKLVQTDPNGAINKFEDSIHSWRQAQDLEPANKAAANNIELARLTIGQVKELLQQQKQQQAQQQDLQKKLEELKDKQQQLSGDTKKQQSEPNQQNNDLSQKQSQLNQETQDTLDQMQQMAQQQGGQDSQDQQQPKAQDQKLQESVKNMQQAAEQQKQAQDTLDKSQLQQAASHQDKAAQEIQKAIDALKDKNKQDQKQSQEQQQQAKDQQQKKDQQQEQQTQQQQQEDKNQQAQQDQKTQEAKAAQATAEEILKDEEKNREKRQILIRGQQKVEKDW